MNETNDKLSAEVISVHPNRVKISVDKLSDFQLADEKLKVGSYLRISDNDNVVLIAIIENFSIEVSSEESKKRRYIIEAVPLGILKDGKFNRGGDSIAIPPKKVEPATTEDIVTIYSQGVEENEKFTFCSLSTNDKIRVPVNGNKLFNKHIAIVGATGSGKSHALSHIIQTAVQEKNDGYEGLNNSHIVIFDIHSEYRNAFKKAKFISYEDLILPYWLLNSEELEDIFLESSDFSHHNQASVLRSVITENKNVKNPGMEKIFFDSPVKFDVNEVYNCLRNLIKETHETDKPNNIQFVTGKDKFNNSIEKLHHYFKSVYEFKPTQKAAMAKGQTPAKIGISKGVYADGKLDKFVQRFYNKISQKRLDFLFGKQSKKICFEDAVKQFMGYKEESNVTVIDLSGIPFEVLSITVSLISRLLFEFGYYYKKFRWIENENNGKPEQLDANNDVPLLLVYEEAHKYAPKSDLSKYRASRESIERIAKEGRKYGVTLLLASQRPSEISETIYSQCNTFIAMRLTNPEDQNFVKKLLPDTLGSLTEKLPSLQAGEALLVGESVVIPSIVKIDKCKNPPSSNDIPYIELWREEWKNVNFEKLMKGWG